MDPRWLAGWSRRVKPNPADVCNKDSEQMITSVHSFVATVDLIIVLKDWQRRPHDADNTWRQLRTNTCTSSGPSGRKRCSFDSIAIFPNFLVCLKVQKTKERNSGLWQTLRCIIYPLPFGLSMTDSIDLQKTFWRKRRLLRNYNLQSKQMKAKQKKAGWFESKVLAVVFYSLHFVCWQSQQTMMLERPGLDPHFLFILWSLGVPAVRHPGGLCFTLFAMNLPRRHYQARSEASVPS